MHKIFHTKMRHNPQVLEKRRVFRLISSGGNALPDESFSVLEDCTIEITNEMLHPPAIPDQTESKPTMPQTPPTIPTVENDPSPHVYVHSADLCDIPRFLSKSTWLILDLH